MAFATSPVVIRLSQRQRLILIELLPDTANVAVGGLFFGQFMAEREFSWLAALTGVVLWGTLVSASLLLARRNR
ncbi:MAG: hypothetical protein AB7I25_09075 [Vicinamibacterales bacterium]